MVSRSAENNPFRQSCLEKIEWSQQSFSFDDIYKCWQEHGWRGQISGAHGAGKTTLSLLLADRAESEGFSVIRLFANMESNASCFQQWQEQLFNADSESIVLMDGFGHAPFLKRYLWKRQYRRLLIAAHEPDSSLPQLVHLKPSIQLVEELVSQLSGKAGQDLLSVRGSEKLLTECDGNLREVFRCLYHDWRRQG